MKRFKKNIGNIKNCLIGATYMTVFQVNNVLAAGDASSVTKPLDNLKTLVPAIITPATIPFSAEFIVDESCA